MKKFKRQNSAACSDVAYRYLCTTGRSPHCIGGYLWGPIWWYIPEGHLCSLAAQCSCPLLCWPGVLPFPHSFKNAFQSAALFKALAATGLLSGTCWVGEGELTLLLFYQPVSNCNFKPGRFLDVFTKLSIGQLGLLLEDFVRLGSGNVVTSNQTEEREGGAQQVYPF